MPALLAPLFVFGLASGLHCVGMCGGIVTAFSAGPQPLVSRTALARRNLLFNLGRISSYAAAGAIVGALGQAAGYMARSLPVQQALFVTANAMLVLAALYLAGVTRALAPLERLGAPLWRRVAPLAVRFAPGRTPGQAYAAGLAWGWLPCGLVYAALAAAALAGSPARGAAAMLAFGLGTLPNLMAAGLAAARLRSLAARRPARLAAAALLGGFGAWGLAHAAGLADAVKGGLLCL